MDKMKVGDTFIDHYFRQWKVILVGDNFYDCQFVECLDGNIRDTPQFKIFEFDDELFVPISQSRRIKDTMTRIKSIEEYLSSEKNNHA